MVMKALSINQPWAWLIANGYKDIENREWATAFRGEVYIHAGKKFDDEAYEWLGIYRPDIALPDAFDLGGIVGTMKIVDCVRDHTSEWFVGRYGFVIGAAELCEKMECIGHLGFFWPDFTSRYKALKPRPKKVKKKNPQNYDLFGSEADDV